MAAWLDYEEGRTAEGLWMREMDKFECLMQAHEYEQRTHGEKDLNEFQGLSSKIRSPEGRAWLGSLQQERSAHLTSIPAYRDTLRNGTLEEYFALKQLQVSHTDGIPLFDMFNSCTVPF